jgi:nickel transport protein
MRGNVKKGTTRRSMVFPIAAVIFASLCLFAAPPHAAAHKVYLFAWVEGDTVYTDSYFPDKRKIIGGKVEVFDPDGKKLLEGQTDDMGTFSFKIPQRTDLRIVLEATMGHRAEFTLMAVELGGEAVKEGTPSESTPEGAGSRAESSSSLHVDKEEIRRVVEESLDLKLKPILRQLARLRAEERPSLREAIGGIGYIVGLMGLVLYFRSRKDRNNRA